MTPYEIFSVIFALSAVGISLITWTGQRKIQRESNDLQRATSELSKKQLEILLREEQGTNTARLSLSLFKDGKTYRFQITNISNVDAMDVDIELLVKRPEDNPIISSEYIKKFPAPKISPDGSISLIAALHLGSPMAYNAILKWTNPDDSKVQEETYVSL